MDKNSDFSQGMKQENVQSLENQNGLILSFKNLLLAANYTDPNCAEYRAAVELCKIAHWYDLLMTRIDIDNRDFDINGRSGCFRIMIKGVCNPSIELSDPMEFKKILSSVSLEELMAFPGIWSVIMIIRFN